MNEHAVPSIIAEYEDTHILKRRDAFYWQHKSGGREYGPFATLVEAVADMQATDAEDLAPDETLEEAEDEIGIASWIDPETGLPAEEGVPRLNQD